MQTLLSTWILTALLHTTLLGLAALLALRFLADPGLRTLVLRIGLFGGLATAGFQVAIGDANPANPLSTALAVGSSEPSGPGRIEASEPPLAETPDPLPRGERVFLGRTLTAQASPSPLGEHWQDLVLWIWIGGAAAGLLRLFKSRRHLLAHLQRESLEDPKAEEMLEDLITPRRARSIRLSASHRIASPLVLSGREICVPATGWRRLPPEERRALLAHELGHIAHRDPAWFLAAQIAQRLLFVQPLARVLGQRLRRESEFRVDDWAIERTRSPLALARCLASIATRTEAQEFAPLLPGLAHQHSYLVMRVERILGKRPPAPSPLKRFACAWISVLSFAAFACSAPRVDNQPEMAVMQERWPLAADALLLTIEENGKAHLQSSAGTGELGWFDLETEDGTQALKGALSEAAAVFPRGGLSIASPLGELVADGTLRMRVADRAAFGYAQRVMTLCGSREVLLWNVELSGTDPGAELYPVPLPVDIVTEGEQGDAPTRRIEVVVRPQDNAPDANHSPYTIITRADSFPIQIEEGDEHVLRELHADSQADLAQVLDNLHPSNTQATVTLDARPGTLYSEVIGALDAVIAAGFTDISFIGEYSP